MNWPAVEPLDIRSGVDRLMVDRMVQIFGASQPYRAYVFANSGTRLRVLVRDGFGNRPPIASMRSNGDGVAPPRDEAAPNGAYSCRFLADDSELTDAYIGFT